MIALIVCFLFSASSHTRLATYLHLVYGKQVGILAHRLLVNHGIRVVLVEIIFKFATGDWFSSHVITTGSADCCAIAAREENSKAQPARIFLVIVFEVLK